LRTIITSARDADAGCLLARVSMPFMETRGETMNPKCTPKGKKGERNILCSYYGHCLDCAIRSAWEYWSCSKCEFKEDEGSAPETGSHVNHAIPFYDLGTKT
jgi:hypothetical protein